MTYIVNDECIKCKYMDCVEVCPVDCFYEGENMLVIHPDECIDCGVCVPECPVDAIKPDTESGLEKWLSLNAEYAKIWPNITVKKALARDPFEVLVRAVDSLDATERTAMRRALHQVLSTLATSGAHRRIGVCPDCTHFGREMCGNLPSTGPSAVECLLLGVPIQPEDVGLLCVHFQPMNQHREDGPTDTMNEVAAAIC